RCLMKQQCIWRCKF
ncbi:TPA: DUF3709 domain-containing protein, partial [Vibrio cholerae]|nr:DUF3709 domain-containing protein [Vibrio cholerae]